MSNLEFHSIVPCESPPKPFFPNLIISLLLIRPKHVHKFMTLLPKDYYLIPGNCIIKLVDPDQMTYTNL